MSLGVLRCGLALLLFVLLVPLHAAESSAQMVSGIVNASDYGVRCDGVSDDRMAIAAAVAALPPTNGILRFPPGTCATNSSLPLISITDRNSIMIQCAGARSTTLQQNGTGDAVRLTGSVEINNVSIQDCALNGNGTAAHGIMATNLKDAVIDRVLISAFTNHAVYITGTNQLHNMIRDSRIVVPAAAPGSVRALKVDQGNAMRLINVYFPGTRTGTGQVAVDLVGSGAGHSLVQGIYEAATIAVAVNADTTSIGEWFDEATVKTAFRMHASNMLTVVGARGIDASKVDLKTFGVKAQYLLWLGNHEAAGKLRAASYTFATLPTSENGTLLYCSDCTATKRCAGSGAGALAKRISGAWVCD
jgi:pectate lyase-like protein